jgi:GntR family transcriptional repressor for pyruvate dehydrogenase complex
MELAEMRKAVAAMRRNIDDSEPFNLADARFHALVASASRSAVLRGTLERLGELALLTRTVVAPNERSRRVALTDVERILLAIERQHPKRAANAMERHIRNVREDYIRMVKNGAIPLEDDSASGQ